jgi:hypothetical protein
MVRVSASRRAALRTKCHALLLRGRLAMVKRTWKKTSTEPGRHAAHKNGSHNHPTWHAAPGTSGLQQTHHGWRLHDLEGPQLFTHPYLAPVSEHLNQTQGYGVKHQPDTHDWRESPLRSQAAPRRVTPDLLLLHCPVGQMASPKSSSSCQKQSPHP